MSVRAIWIPSRTITITVSAHNSGRGRMVRVDGPTGQAGMVPHDIKDWGNIISWVGDIINGELGVAMGQLDEEAQELERP